jgi:uncharacterized protein with HEPN domain
LPSRHTPAASLAHIVDNAARIDGYITGMDQAGFRQNRLVGDAVERCLERVCEAVYRVGPRAETLMPGQPWADIRSMGNRLRHAYDQISVEIVWSTIRYELPQLEVAARKARANFREGARTERPV